MSAGSDPLLGRSFPRPPAHAWRWLQRSRPVLRAIADRLTGAPPGPAFLEELQRSFDDDAFTRAIVIDTIAEVAFSGRVPNRHPPGATWDRGLRWWAATLAGVTPSEFDQPAAGTPTQADLFDAEDAHALDDTDGPDARPAEARRDRRPDERSAGQQRGPEEVGGAADATALARAARRAPRRVSPERIALARTLRELLAAAEGGQVPATAIRQLIAELEGDDTTDR